MKCETCDGTGYIDSEHPCYGEWDCAKCKGTGKVDYDQVKSQWLIFSSSEDLLDALCQICEDQHHGESGSFVHRASKEEIKAELLSRLEKLNK